MAISRSLPSELRLLKTKYPIIALTGPRQSGKTTLMKYYLLIALSFYPLVILNGLSSRQNFRSNSTVSEN